MRNSAIAITVIAVFLSATPSVFAGDESVQLQHAIKLFDQGDYAAAQEVIVAIDRAGLSADEQTRRDDYLQRLQEATLMQEKSQRDLEDAEVAMAAGENKQAQMSLQAVVDNEYASPGVRQAADIHLRNLNQAAQSGAPSASPQAGEADRTRVLVGEADDLVRAGRYEEARRLYEQAIAIVPGYPEAVEGLRTVQEHQRNLVGSRTDSLAERLRRQDAINWQRTVAQFRDAENQIRRFVGQSQFNQADQMLVRAEQIVEAGKQFADPSSDYDALKSDYDLLSDMVRDESRRHNEEVVARTREDIERQRQDRLGQVEENRVRQVESLMEQALQHRKDGDLAAAVNVLMQVTVIDPQYKPARWLMDTLDDQRQHLDARETRKLFYKKTRGALEDVERAKIPWYEEIEYPDDWLERLALPTRSRPGQSRPDSLLLGALDRTMPADFNRVPFGEVMERLVDANDINIQVNWQDLQLAGVDRNAPIDLQLPREIALKKVLSEVLEQAGAGKVDLGFEVSEGVVTVATRERLDRDVFMRVYDISDLLMEVPNFTNAPMVDLRDATAKPAPVNADAKPWAMGDDDDDEYESDPERQSRVRKVIRLIQDSIQPDGWRQNGGSGGSIREINGQLVVTQNAAAQRQIRGLLDRLRQERAIQVAVEALFITVSSHYLEEMGMDLDIVLNAGNAGFDFLNAGAGPATDPTLGSNLLLPRTSSRLGFTPNVPPLGTALATPGGVVNQPFSQAFLVPQAAGGSGSQLTPVPVRTGLLGITDPSALPSDIPGSFGGQAIGPALSIFGSFLDNIQVDFLVRATQADSRSTVLTAPRLVVFNGGSAWVAVTIQQNFISQLQPVVNQGAVAQAPVTGTIDAGASLFVRATVTADKRYVMMLLAPGVTRLLDLQTFQFSGGTGANQAFIQLPTLSAQRMQTVVSVPDGGTLLIGGQKLASETEVEAGVPILSKIPVLKRLYSARSMVKDEQTLLILIKPKILIQSEQEEQAFPSFSQR